MSVGERIRYLRKSNGIKSQEELAYLVDTARQTISLWERDVCLPEGAIAVYPEDVYLAMRQNESNPAEKAAENLFSVYPDENAIAAADADDIEKLIRSAGLSKSKSKNIKGTAEAVAASGLPDTMEGLMSLPGVGEKTASCYMHSILGRPAVIADTHFVRVAKRLGFTDTDDRNKSAKEIRERFPSSQWSRMSMVVNMHGRTVCRPKPRCMECPVRTLCPSSDAASAGS